MSRNTLYETDQPVICLIPCWPHLPLTPSRNTYISTVTAVCFSFICCARGFISSNLALCQFDGIDLHAQPRYRDRKKQNGSPYLSRTASKGIFSMSHHIRFHLSLNSRDRKTANKKTRLRNQTKCPQYAYVVWRHSELWRGSPSDSHSTVHDAGVNHTSTLSVCRQQ